MFYVSLNDGTTIILANAMKAKVSSTYNFVEFFDDRSTLVALYSLEHVKGFFKDER